MGKKWVYTRKELADIIRKDIDYHNHIIASDTGDLFNHGRVSAGSQISDLLMATNKRARKSARV